MPTFIQGLDLAEAFYVECVRPILDDEFPDLLHAAALIGTGSDVLGFDTEQSTDHGWGPRLQLFLTVDDYANRHKEINEALRNRLPYTFRGYSTHFVQHDSGSPVLAQIDYGPVNHKISLFTVSGARASWLGVKPDEPMTLRHWLTTPQQVLATLTGGRVFHDDIGDLTVLRESLAYYPYDIWLYMLACQWSRIAEEEAFIGRTGQVGDELGSAVIATRLVGDLMQLCFFMERRYAPYAKWFGTAFSRLDCAATMQPLLTAVLRSDTWKTREVAMNAAYEQIAAMHNALGITEPLSTSVMPFHDRPFSVISGERFASAIRACITDPEVAALPHGVGGIDQFVQNTNVLSNPEMYQRFGAIYEG